MENMTDLRKKEYEVLKGQAFEKKKELLEKDMSVKLGKAVSYKRKDIKKEVARIKTILREKELLNAK